MATDKKKETIVILDTNFLYVPVEFRVDVFSEIDKMLVKYKLVIFDKTLDEIKDKTVKALVEHKIKSKELFLVKTKDHYIDDAIVDYAKANENKENIVVATQDSALKKRLSKLKCSLIYLRGKRKLELIKATSEI